MRSSASIALLAAASTAGALQQSPAAHRAPLPRVRTPPLRASLFADAAPGRKAERLSRIASIYGLDPVEDRIEIETRAASSLPEEEDGTWTDLAFCTLRNAAVVGVLLAAIGGIPGQASAAVLATGPTILAADAETFDVIASIAVPLLVGGGFVVFAAMNYEKLIDKLNE